jgi:hypothetical protein
MLPWIILAKPSKIAQVVKPEDERETKK